MANDGVGVDVKGLARGPTREAGSRDLIQPVSGPIDMINSSNSKKLLHTCIKNSNW